LDNSIIVTYRGKRPISRWLGALFFPANETLAMDLESGIGIFITCLPSSNFSGDVFQVRDQTTGRQFFLQRYFYKLFEKHYEARRLIRFGDEA